MRNIIRITNIIFYLVFLSSCEKEGNDNYNNSSENKDSEKPTIEIISSASSTSELRVAFKTTGGIENIVTLYYGKSEDYLNKSTKCTYYNGTKKNQYYKGLVVGLDRGSRIYFKGKVKNGNGSSETKVQSKRIQ